MFTCSSCRFFSALDNMCRRNPPTAFPVPNQLGQLSIMGIFPPTQASSLACGEHKGRAEDAQLLEVNYGN